jgi:asparagine synthase (glutamine-hydrolysing)
MLSRIAHRGPDGDGAWHHQANPWHVSLGHRRLSIIDLETGAQPMGNEDGSVVITYNGEVYNFLELRPRLERAGHRFATKSDTETIIHQVEEHGPAGIEELNGMFAFAMWDSKRRRLLLARDRVGIKPLYYAELADGGLAFASELSSLLAHGGIDETLSNEGLLSYFFSDYVHPPLSIVRGAKKLAPGHTLLWEDGRLEAAKPFWRLSTPNQYKDGQRSEELARELWARLGRAVESQLIADVPVGIFLSGGIDSSCVATLAAERAGQRMKAFSIGFENQSFDESAYARLVASRLKVEHISETLHERNLLDVVDAALDKVDEPFADPSLLPTFLLSRLAARHVKVVVGGDGGDELWGGYPTYRAQKYAALYRRIPASLRNRLSLAATHLPIRDGYQTFEWKVRRFTHRWDDDLLRRHLRWMSNVDLPELGLALPEARGMLPATLATSLPATSDWLNQVLALDFMTYMPGSVLTKVDRASMAHGLEVRPPFLDNELVAWAFSLPSRYKLRGTSGKFLLKLAARGAVPDQVIARKKKGFAIPLASWLSGPLRDRIAAVVSASPLWDLGPLNQRVFATWFEEHLARGADRSKPLWALFVLDHWWRRRQAPPSSAHGS